MRFAVVPSLLLSSLAFAACQSGEKQQIRPVESGSATTAPGAEVSGIPQMTPPLDLKAPPGDALKTSSGLVYKKLSTVESGTGVQRNDTVLIKYTGWRQANGETFFTNRDEAQPMPLPLANAAPGFVEAMTLMRRGERAMLWIPPSIGYRGEAGDQKHETLCYEVEIVEVLTAPAVPKDLGVAAATATTLPLGTKKLVLRPGTGTEPARYFDTVTFNYSAWDIEGRMFDSTEMRGRPATAPPFRQTAAMEEILTSLTAGERARFWVTAERMQTGGKPIPGMPPGMLTYEVEMIGIEKGREPPKKPADVAAPPASASKTAKGVFYKVLGKGKGGPKPSPIDVVRVNYTGWTTDGRMFDSSTVKGEPGEFSLGGVMSGWTEAIPIMSVGDKMRFWIPEELAHKGSPGKPQGMLVFDIELVEIKTSAQITTPDAQGLIPAPKDVAAPPEDAKKTAKGVFYKILKAVKGSVHPDGNDRVKVHYTGWSTDGKMFDTSRKRPQPAEFELEGGVITGWTDGIPQVGVGEQARLWIPASLAYEQGGGPPGMLVFDIELVEVIAKP